MICRNCKTIFDDPKGYVERHSAEYAEEFACCPTCGSTEITDSYVCPVCGVESDKQGVCVPCREAIGKDVDSNFQSLMAAYLLDAMPLLEIVMEHMEGYDENFIQHIGA